MREEHMNLNVEILEHIEDIASEEWDDVVRKAHAPIFYKHSFLSAYELAPLQPLVASFYLIVREKVSEQACAVLPVYLVKWSDPLHVLERVFPSCNRDETHLLLTHVWHCYDTWLPTIVSTQELAETIYQGLATIKRKAHVRSCGFVNVADTMPVFPLLAEMSTTTILTETRFCLDLTTFATMDEYLAQIRKSPRHTLRRYYRRAMDAGVEVCIEQLPFTSLHETVNLCQSLARKHANSSYYDAEILERFILLMGSDARLIAIRLRGELIAASVCFLDNERFHTWAGGADYSVEVPFSANYVLFYEEIRAAKLLNCSVLEAGRRNRDFKLRYGMYPVSLYACFG